MSFSKRGLDYVFLTFPDRLMSNDPTAAMREGMIRGRMSAFSIRRKRFPMYAM